MAETHVGQVPTLTSPRPAVSIFPPRILWSSSHSLYPDLPQGSHSLHLRRADRIGAHNHGAPHNVAR